MDGDGKTYLIGDLVKEFRVTARALRFYEDKGLIKPRREGQTRIYDHKARARLQLILRGKAVGFSLVEIGELLDLYTVDPAHRVQMHASLLRCREQLAKLVEQREEIAHAITHLEGAIEDLEMQLAQPVDPANAAMAQAFERAAAQSMGFGDPHHPTDGARHAPSGKSRRSE